MVDKDDKCELLNAAIDEELKAVFDYDEMLELLPEDAEAIVKVMKEEAEHAIMFKEIAVRKGCKESEIWQKIEDALNVIELSALEKMITKTA